jgi:hypothetical protein
VTGKLRGALVIVINVLGGLKIEATGKIRPGLNEDGKNEKIFRL